MSVSANAVWEVRTAGSNTNGGGFVVGASGVDYSQQDSAQYSFTDLASTSGNSAQAIVTSASHSFVANDVGNILRINAGTNFTVGWYEIVSVNAGAATLDRGCGTVATISGGSYKVGGAVNFANSSTPDSLLFAAMRNTVYIKAGTYSMAGASGGSGKTTVYTSSRGDNSSGAARATINTTSAITFSTGWQVNDLIISNVTTSTTINTAASTKVNNCKIINTTSGGTSVVMSGAETSIMNCEVISYKGTGISLGNSTTGNQVLFCYVHDCSTGIAASAVSVPRNIRGCVIEGCYTTALNIGSSYSFLTIDSCTLYGAENKLGTAVSISGATPGPVILTNSIIAGFVTGVTSATAAPAQQFINSNNFYNNTTDRTNISTGTDDVAVNPQFLSVTQITGTTATHTATVLTDSGANFTNVVDGRDYIYLISGTSVTAGYYGIVSHTTTTITVDVSIGGTSAVADTVYQITVGKNYGVGANLRGLGYPKTHIGGNFVSYNDVGAVSSNANPSLSTDPGIANVKTGVSYSVNGSSLTGTYAPTRGRSSIG